MSAFDFTKTPKLRDIKGWTIAPGANEDYSLVGKIINVKPTPVPAWRDETHSGPIEATAGMRYTSQNRGVSALAFRIGDVNYIAGYDAAVKQFFIGTLAGDNSITRLVQEPYAFATAYTTFPMVAKVGAKVELSAMDKTLSHPLPAPAARTQVGVLVRDVSADHSIHIQTLEVKPAVVSTPTEPTPTDPRPTDPTPTDPTPTDPTPTDPTPTDPTDPVEPGDPTDPNPTDPTDPTDPGNEEEPPVTTPTTDALDAATRAQMRAFALDLAIRLAHARQHFVDSDPNTPSDAQLFAGAETIYAFIAKQPASAPAPTEPIPTA